MGKNLTLGTNLKPLFFIGECGNRHDVNGRDTPCAKALFRAFQPLALDSFELVPSLKFAVL